MSLGSTNNYPGEGEKSGEEKRDDKTITPNS